MRLRAASLAPASRRAQRSRDQLDRFGGSLVAPLLSSSSSGIPTSIAPALWQRLSSVCALGRPHPSRLRPSGEGGATSSASAEVRSALKASNQCPIGPVRPSAVPDLCSLRARRDPDARRGRRRPTSVVTNTVADLTTRRARVARCAAVELRNMPRVHTTCNMRRHAACADADACACACACYDRWARDAAAAIRLPGLRVRVAHNSSHVRWRRSGRHRSPAVACRSGVGPCGCSWWARVMRR